MKYMSKVARNVIFSESAKQCWKHRGGDWGIGDRSRVGWGIGGRYWGIGEGNNIHVYIYYIYYNIYDIYIYNIYLY
jgi:hypothetical protein